MSEFNVNFTNISWRGAVRLPKSHPQLGRGTSLPRHHSLSAFGSSYLSAFDCFFVNVNNIYNSTFDHFEVTTQAVQFQKFHLQNEDDDLTKCRWSNVPSWHNKINSQKGSCESRQICREYPLPVQFFFIIALQENVWPWKWRWRSQSTPIAMVPFDCK